MHTRRAEMREALKLLFVTPQRLDSPALARPATTDMKILQWLPGLLLWPLTSAKPPPPGNLWWVWPPLDYSDPLYCGWDQIPFVKEVEIYNGVANSRTYAHHPELFAVGKNVFLIHSAAAVDEDSMGQDVWISTSHDGGLSLEP